MTANLWVNWTLCTCLIPFVSGKTDIFKFKKNGTLKKAG